MDKLVHVVHDRDTGEVQVKKGEGFYVHGTKYTVDFR
jgi:hypothetical protein